MSWDWSKEDDEVVAVIENGCLPDALIKNSNGKLMIRDRNLPLGWFESSRDINYYKSIHKGRLHIRPEKTEWTIYNNDKPFGELNDEQKGALMVASLSAKITVEHPAGRREIYKPLWTETAVYRAKQPEPSMTDKNEEKNPKAMCINCEEPEVSNNLCACCGWLQKEGKYEVKS
tara:strand:+ start:5773 stop:6294 length:522 start_codon:yes stop_codon:yes gene_type:complete